MYTPSNIDQSNRREVFSVAELNRRARFLLETHLPLVWVEGELSNVSIPSSGHWYFTLKDEQAQVRGAMFRNRNMGVSFRPEHGQQVLIRAKISLYEGRGDYQLIAEHMELAGTGALQRAFEQLKIKLAHEGLFDMERKRPLPRFPKHICIVTSPTGAAIHDIISVLKRRYPDTAATLIPVAVQGKESAPQLCKALEIANRYNDFDVILIGRGGGSLEDLWPFNEESVARAIAGSAIPVVSAVGHEVDFTVADFVADLRAPTPTAAAELITPDAEELLDHFCGLEVSLEDLIASKINKLKDKVNLLQHRIKHPKQRLEQQSQRLDHLEHRLNSSIVKTISTKKNHLDQAIHRFDLHHPKYRLANYKERLLGVSSRLPALAGQLIQPRQTKLAGVARLLNTLNPLNTLARGYSITTHATSKQIITRGSDVLPGEDVTIKLADGLLEARVLESHRLDTK